MSKLGTTTVLETACRAMLLATLADNPRLQVTALDELTKNGARIETWSDKMISAFRHALDEVVNEEADHDPMFKRVLEDLEEFRAPKADVSPSHHQHREWEDPLAARHGREWRHSSY